MFSRANAMMALQQARADERRVSGKPTRTRDIAVTSHDWMTADHPVTLPLRPAPGVSLSHSLAALLLVTSTTPRSRRGFASLSQTQPSVIVQLGLLLRGEGQRERGRDSLQRPRWSLTIMCRGPSSGFAVKHTVLIGCSWESILNCIDVNQ